MDVARRAVTSVFLLCAITAGAQEQKPWQLTTAERIARRLDPERIRAERERGANQHGSKSTAPFVIDGRETPELFLRTELMAFLLSDFGDLVYRIKLLDSYRPKLVEFGWQPEDFWRDFEDSSFSYYDHRSVADGTHESIVLTCRSRAEAREAMVKKYPRFDEFLYRAVAPRQSLAGDRIVPADELLWLEGGCR